MLLEESFSKTVKRVVAMFQDALRLLQDHVISNILKKEIAACVDVGMEPMEIAAGLKEGAAFMLALIKKEKGSLPPRELWAVCGLLNDYAKYLSLCGRPFEQACVFEHVKDKGTENQKNFLEILNKLGEIQDEQLHDKSAGVFNGLMQYAELQIRGVAEEIAEHKKLLDKAFSDHPNHELLMPAVELLRKVGIDIQIEPTNERPSKA